MTFKEGNTQRHMTFFYFCFFGDSKSKEFHPNYFYMLCFDQDKLVLKKNRKGNRN